MDRNFLKNITQARQGKIDNKPYCEEKDIFNSKSRKKRLKWVN